jgi:catechol 2,3-dioxygenase-like lactoylglutathione lyase family enzyme
MKARAISHIAVCVRDLDESLLFYRDTLGMTLTMDAVQDTRGGLTNPDLQTPGK